MTLDLLCRCRQTECTDSSMVLASNKRKVLFLEPKKMKADWKRLQNRTGKAFSFFPTLDIHTYQRSWSHSRKNSQSPQFSHTWVFVKTSLSLAAAPSACRGDTWVFFKSYRASRQLFFYHSPIPKCQKILLLVARRRRRRSSKSLKMQRSPKP
jgi:hypothetical protein